MRKLDKATKILAKLAETACWIGTVGMLVGLVLVLLFGERAVIGTPEAEPVLTVGGFEIVAVDAAGQLDMAAVKVYLAGGAILLALMAMVFRNVYLILKRSEHASPFQPDNVRMVREIGIFLIAQPVVGLILSSIARLLLGPEKAEIRVDVASILPGLVVLCLSQFFARGMELESDVDGLL